MKNQPRADRATAATSLPDVPRKAGNPAPDGNSLAANALDLSAIAAILAFAAYGIFVLPYSFPPTTTPALFATSQEVGFNNRVSLLTTLAVIGLFGLRSMFWPRDRPEVLDSVFAPASPAGSAYSSMPKSLLLLAGLMNVALILAIYSCIPHLDTYGESMDTLPRLELAMRCHLQPYRDVLFNYGPLMFYLPLSFIKVGAWFGATMDASFISFFICDVLLGLWLLFYVIDNLRIDRAYRMVIFGVLAASMLLWVLSFGIQGTGVRYVGPYAALLAVHKAAQRWPPFQSRQSTLRFFAVNVACVLAILSVSPDMGLAYIVAQSAYFVHRAVFSDRRWLWAVAATVAGFPLFLAIFPAFLDGMAQFAKGNADLPIIPAPYVILYFLTLFWLLPVLLRHCASWRPGENTPLILALALFVTATIPASLGRCDMGHIVCNGLGAFLLALVVLSILRPRLFPVYTLAFLVVGGIVMSIATVVSYAEHLQPVRMVLAGQSLPPEPTTSPLVGPLKLEKYSAVATPFGTDRLTKKWLMDTGRFVPLYHATPQQLPEGDLPRLIKDVSKADAILVPERFLGVEIMQLKNVTDEQIRKGGESQMPQEEANINSMLGILNFFPVRCKAKYPAFNPWVIEGRYFASYFDPVERAEGWLVMVPKTATAPATEPPGTLTPDPPRRPGQ